MKFKGIKCDLKIAHGRLKFPADRLGALKQKGKRAKRHPKKINLIPLKLITNNYSLFTIYYSLFPEQ